MASLTVLQARVKALQTQAEPASKNWMFIVEQGKDITLEQRAHIRARDRVVIREIPRGFLEDIKRTA